MVCFIGCFWPSCFGESGGRGFGFGVCVSSCGGVCGLLCFLSSSCEKSLLCRMSVLIGEAGVKGFWFWKYILLCRIRNILYRLLFMKNVIVETWGK